VGFKSVVVAGNEERTEIELGGRWGDERGTGDVVRGVRAVRGERSAGGASRRVAAIFAHGRKKWPGD
jgi:hypothetical protein